MAAETGLVTGLQIVARYVTVALKFANECLFLCDIHQVAVVAWHKIRKVVKNTESQPICCHARGSRVEQIPGAFADAQELVALGPLGLGAVPPSTERSSSSSGRRAVTQGWAATLLVLSSRTSLAGAAAVVLHLHAIAWRGRRGRLVASVVNNLGQKLRSATSQLMLGLLGRSVLAGSGRHGRLRLLSVAGRRGRAVAGAGVQGTAVVAGVVRRIRVG